MKNQLKKLGTLVSSMLLILPTASYGGVGTLADEPLWLGESVRHNLMLVMDDSGSMDWETLFGSSDGLLGWDTVSQSFVDANGSYRQGYSFGYLFPNGIDGKYVWKCNKKGECWKVYDWEQHKGRRMYPSIYGILPVKAYAYARSADYNASYYNPNDTYTPWPDAGEGFVFDDIDATKAPFEPVTELNEAGTVDLTHEINTALKDKYWKFLVGPGMVCDDKGTSCTKWEYKDAVYFPATYYVKDVKGEYTYLGEPGAATSGKPTQEEATLFEAEDGTLEGPLTRGAELLGAKGLSDEEKSALEAALGSDDASNDVLGTLRDTSINSTSTPPEEGNAAYKVYGLTGKVKIWIKIYAPSTDHNLFWVNLQGNATIDSTTSGTSKELAGQTWYKFAVGKAKVGKWVWKRWANVDATGPFTLNIRHGKTGAYIDQILVTTDTSYVPKGKEHLDPVTTSVVRSCATDIKPSHYHEFKYHPERFEGVDAIGPDGGCLKKVEIKPGKKYGERTYEEEIQNFANWFTYYRKRHQALRGGMAAALQGINGFRVGMFWLNNRLSLKDLVMRDWGEKSEEHALLQTHYKTVNRAGTPIRTALKHAGDLFNKAPDSGEKPVITAECQKNFTLLFTDGYNTDVSSLDGIGNEDGDWGAPYEDEVSSTIADVAAYFYKNRLRADATSLPEGKVSVSEACKNGTAEKWEDCETDLHMNTFVATLGTKGSFFGITHNSVKDAYDTTPSWPTEGEVNQGGSYYQVDDLYHAALNGRGEMYNASSVKDLQDKLSEAVRDIVKKVGSSAGVTFNTASLESDTLLYSATFNSSGWSGELEAKRLDKDGKVKDTAWKASEKLDTRDLATDPRTILTYNVDATVPDGVPFQWSALPDIARDDLNYVGSSAGDGLGEHRLAYLRGDRTYESSLFRVRTSRLGDIVNSSPVVVGKPAMSWPDTSPFGAEGDRYSEFKYGREDYESVGKRETMIYVGANDGMLHGFEADEDGGRERLAYVPAALFSTENNKGLRYLTDPDYKHRYYVDLTPVASDVYLEGAWKTILVGGLRAGGRGLFALDVTDPADFGEEPTKAAKTVLWEFTAKDDPDLGYITEPPVVAMMNNGKWAVIFGNGYGSTSGKGGTPGTGKVFILFIEEGLDGNWSGGYVKLDTGVTAGVSGVAVADVDGDKVADRLYAGDDQGNLWVFDVTAKNTSSWRSAYGTKTKPAPLFIATDSKGVRQPITSAPGIQFHPTVKSGSDPNILVVFGTGKYLSEGDNTDTQVQSFYAVWDRGDGSLSRDDLLVRTLTEKEKTVSTADGDKTVTIRELDGDEIKWEDDPDTAVKESEYGFYFDFSTREGERLVHKPLLRNDHAVFVTTIPEVSACAGGGSSWLMVVPLSDGKTPEAPVVDIGGDNELSGDPPSVGVPLQDLNNKPAYLSKKIYTSKSDQSSGTGTCGEGVNCTEVDLGGEDNSVGRMGWHELFIK